MKVEALGDSAYVLRDLDGPAWVLANALNASPPAGLQEAVAAYDTVGLYVDPDVFDPASLTSVGRFVTAADPIRRHEIPVCYELGPDLLEGAERLGLTPEEVIQRHADRPYRCYAIGFCPGFPYLGYLDDAIARLPRRSTPRVRVPVGAVAIAGRQTGIYPEARPGGWWLIGQTPICIADEATGYFPIAAGDEVTFVPISRSEFAKREGERL